MRGDVRQAATYHDATCIVSLNQNFIKGRNMKMFQDIQRTWTRIAQFCTWQSYVLSIDSCCSPVVETEHMRRHCWSVHETVLKWEELNKQLHVKQLLGGAQKKLSLHFVQTLLPMVNPCKYPSYFHRNIPFFVAPCAKFWNIMKHPVSYPAPSSSNYCMFFQVLFSLLHGGIINHKRKSRDEPEGMEVFKASTWCYVATRGS